MITPEIKVNEDIILECSNLDHEIKQKILHNSKKNQELSFLTAKYVQGIKCYKTNLDTKYEAREIKLR